MHIKKIHLVYFSPVFHTMVLGRALSRELANGIGLDTPLERDITAFPQEDGVVCFAPDDLVVFAAPVYGGRIPAASLERFGRFGGKDTPAVVLVSYGNRAYEDALLELSDKVKECGFKTIAGAACIAEHTIVPSCASGRPDSMDLTSVKDFAQALAAFIKTEMAFTSPEIPGNRPYRDFKASPLPQTVDDNCIHCGLCARECPAQAIDFDDQSIVDKDKCFCCMRCVNICPARARHPMASFIKAVSEKLVPLCAKRKENAFFVAK